MTVDRRVFLRSAGAAAASALMGRCGGRAGRDPDPKPRLVVVLFGGGTRSCDTVEDPRHRFIPHLWRELVPRGTLLSNVRVEGRVVHPLSAGSIVTGHWEWDDLDWTRPVAHPTLFERFRRARRAPDTDAWLFAYASILSQAGVSRAPGHGAAFGANVVEPPTIPRWAADHMDRLLRVVAARGDRAAERRAAQSAAELARAASRIETGGLRSKEAADFLRAGYRAWRRGRGSTSHDAFLTDQAIRCMRRFAPAVVTVMYGEIDCAHYGSWSRYTEAIQRTDRLVHRLWREIQRLPAYRDRTLLLVLPDHGREQDGQGWGFVHHSDFYTNRGADEACRRVWLLAVGPGVRAGARIHRPVPITAVAATGLEHLGVDPGRGAARSVLGWLRPARYTLRS